ncbi:Endonuclease-reverse transcriptase [Popillia japonica]|uniref:Endonuclease-reverse transcriptase n=1 Tax=Popillia japonica TaxID=7064 RepID=A0AAW1LVH7_POPJA
MTHDLAYTVGCEKKTDIIIISEPNKKIVKDCNYITGNSSNVAMFISNKNAGIVSHAVGDGYDCVSWKEWCLYGYVSPNIPLEEFKCYIDTLMQDVIFRKRAAIITGDCNSKAPLWGSPVTDKRGEYLIEWAEELNLSIMNSGNTSTFERGDTGSFIDITWATEGMVRRVSKWEVYTYHHHIYFEVA